MAKSIDFSKLVDFSIDLLVVPFSTVLYEFWELGVHFLICFGSRNYFLKFYFLWSRVPRKVPGKFFRSGRITGNDNLEKNPTSESDFNKISTRKSTSDPKILKLFDGWVNMFITMVLTIFLSRGTRIARSNLRRPPLDDFGSTDPGWRLKIQRKSSFPLYTELIRIQRSGLTLFLGWSVQFVSPGAGNGY